jgi:hypothetical protein
LAVTRVSNCREIKETPITNSAGQHLLQTAGHNAFLRHY